MTTSIQIPDAAIVLTDISGYTSYMLNSKRSVVHAQEIIFSLLETIIDKSVHPLILNKLEGDAALFYSDLRDDPVEAARSIVAQVYACVPMFRGNAGQLTKERASCDCGACQNIHILSVKSIIHRGSLTIRRIREFQEIGGTDVIIAHRLLKNSVGLREYIMMSEPFYQLAAAHLENNGEKRTEHYDDIGPIDVRVFHPGV